MKRKFFSIIMSLLLVLASVLTLAACNNDNGDKAAQNKDFVEYRKKIVTVLKDNGIFVNDLDAKARTAALNSSAPSVDIATPSADGEQNSIDTIMAKNEYLADRADYEFALKQVFGMSLKMSLCLGDGISNYFGEKQFFDIPVNLNGSYISVSQSGTVSTVLAYSPYDAGADTFDTIYLDFKSASDYSFTVVSINDNHYMFATGNAQKYFLMIYDGTEVVYSPNGNTFYRTDKQDAAKACVNLIDESLLDINCDDFYALKTNVRYTFNDAQTSTLFDKYFKDIQSSAGVIEGLQYKTDGGIRYADSYVAIHDETEVEITAGTEYISDHFTVYDKSGSVKSLYIPKSVKGVVQISDPKTGQEYDTPKIVTALNSDNFNLALTVEGEDFAMVFDRIGVESGSPLFKSGSGHLQALDGSYLYIADTPFEQFDEALYDDNLIAQIHEGKERGYFKNLFSAIKTMDIDVDAEYYTSQTFDSFWHELDTLFTSLESVSVHGKYRQQGLAVNLCFKAYKNLTVDVDFEGEFTQENNVNSIGFSSGDGTNHSVTVNLHGFSLLASVFAEGVNATVNIEVANALYTCSQIIPPATEGSVTLKYADASLSEAQRLLAYALHTRGGKKEVIATVETKEIHGGIVIPESVGIDVTALTLCNSDTLEYVQFGKHIKYLIFANDYNNDISYTVRFDGSYEEFESVQIVCYGEGYSFNLVCNDRQELVSGGKAIPDDEKCTITVKFTDAFGQPSTLVFEHAKGRELNHITSELMCGGSYVIIGDDYLTVGTVSIADTDPNNFYNFGISINEKFITGDATFTIIPEPERVEQNVNLSADGFTLTGVFDGWGMINNVSISIQFDGYRFEDSGTYIAFNEFGTYNSGEIMYSSQIARFTLSLKLTGSGYVITLESFTIEIDPASQGKK